MCTNLYTKEIVIIVDALSFGNKNIKGGKHIKKKSNFNYTLSSFHLLGYFCPP